MSNHQKQGFFDLSTFFHCWKLNAYRAPFFVDGNSNVLVARVVGGLRFKETRMEVKSRCLISRPTTQSQNRKLFEAYAQNVKSKQIFIQIWLCFVNPAVRPSLTSSAISFSMKRRAACISQRLKNPILGSLNSDRIYFRVSCKSSITLSLWKRIKSVEKMRQMRFVMARKTYTWCCFSWLSAASFRKNRARMILYAEERQIFTRLG